ncbi:hypothetical protein GJ496_000081 [Pomphorhynchus laevis]|nr:hypothetical protein GJ496_000081 [Pomphorhynchus laevis]
MESTANNMPFSGILARLANTLYGYNSRVIVSRHAERVDVAFGPTWVHKAFNSFGGYTRFNCNMPAYLPIRQNINDYLWDTPITYTGEDTSHRVGQLLRHYDNTIDYCFASPALRCVQTASKILQGYNSSDIMLATVKKKIRHVLINIEPALYECTKWYGKTPIRYMSPFELHVAGFDIDLKYVPVVSTLNLNEDELGYYERSQLFIQTLERSILSKSNKQRNILIVGHAATPDVISKSLLKLAPQPEKLSENAGKVDFSGLSILERIIIHTLFNLILKIISNHKQTTVISFPLDFSDILIIKQLSDEIEEMLTINKLDEKRVASILNELKRNKIALFDLQQTGIGRSLNNLRKLLTNDSQITQCRNILKGWKRLVEASKNAATHPSTTPSSASKRKSRGDDNADGSNNTSSPPVKRLSQSSKESPKEQAENKERCSESDLAVRLKCREMLTKALHVDIEGESDVMVDIAIKIESTIYSDMNMNTSSKYRNQIRSRVYNLKDSKNPTLRSRVCNGEIDPLRFARMTADELASDEMKKARQQMTKEAIDEHQMALSGGTVTDLIKCSRCKQNQCTYNQVQTRSADEPMTTFVYCNLCGHRWKFG